MGPLKLDAAGVFAEAQKFQKKLTAGMKVLGTLDDVQFGVTPKEEVYREDKLVVYRFRGDRKPTAKTPTLIVYALVNRPYMVDLQEDKSLVRNLLAQGEDIYLIDWGYPDRADRWLTLDDYINGYIRRSVDAVARHAGVKKINVLGICQGGAFSLCFSAIHPQKVKNLITMVTPVDFHTPDNMLSNWTRNVAAVRAEVRGHGRHPRRQGRAGELPAHGEMDLRFTRPGRRGVSPVHARFLPGQQAAQGRFAHRQA